jgi:hypothetical protein
MISILFLLKGGLLVEALYKSKNKIFEFYYLTSLSKSKSHQVTSLLIDF